MLVDGIGNGDREIPLFSHTLLSIKCLKPVAGERTFFVVETVWDKDVRVVLKVLDCAISRKGVTRPGPNVLLSNTPLSDGPLSM